MTENPFKFGDPVDGKYYYPRPQLTQVIRQFLENKIHVVLMGPRRFGKTSFILDLLQKLEATGYNSLFVDIFNITSHRDFLQQILRALKSRQTWFSRFKSWVVSVAKLRPKLSFEIDPQTGESTVSLAPEFSSENDVKEIIQDTLESFNFLGEKIVVAIDEFQKIAELDDGGWLEATLRTQMQHLKNVAFIFSGSRQSIIHDMLNKPSRPFYRSCQPVEFPSFDSDFSRWIVERFASIGIKCELEAVEELRKLVQDTTNYIQMVCYHLVATVSPQVEVGKSDVYEMLKAIVRQNTYTYQTTLDSLSPIQQRVLRLAAIEEENIFSKELLDKYEIPSSPALASAIKALKEKHILDEGVGRGKVFFDDPLFAIWLKMEFDGSLF